MNRDIANIFRQMADLLEINGEKVPQRINAYKKAASYLDGLTIDVAEIYKEKGITGLKVPRIIGDKNAQKIVEYLKKGRIKDFEELKEETSIRQVITHFFKSKGLSLQELKENAKKRKIIYSRFTKPAKQLLELAGSNATAAGGVPHDAVKKAKEAIDTVAAWANSRKLDYTIETVFKKWLELDRLKPKEIIKKPFYKGDPMVWSEAKRKWYVISKQGEWLLFAGKEKDMEWKTIE